jgi:DNA polymerase-3 subunit epsilon
VRLAGGALSWPPETPIEDVRFVVLDSETTGLNPLKDRIVTIGAIAVVDQEILIEDSFEALLRVEYNSSSVTIHGVTREESLAGMDEPQALQQFLKYLGDGVIVGHHIGHDVATFNAGYERHFGFRLENPSLDTMDLTLHLERDGAFAGQETIRQFSLDALCTMFDIIPHDRHTAPGDAFITALVFQRLLRLGRKHGRTTLGSLLEPFEADVETADS